MFFKPMNIVDLLRIAAHVVPRVPPRIGYPLCDVLGAALGPQLPAWPHIQANLCVLMPDARLYERERAARRLIGHFFKNYYDLFRFHTLPPAALDQTLVLYGTEHLHAALAQQRGVLLVAPHCGNYTIIVPPAIRHFNTRALWIVEQLADPRLHELMNRVRMLAGVDVAPLSPTIGRIALRALRQNHIVVLGGDRAIAKNSLIVDFFGQPTPLPSGPATLALRTQAPVITGYTHRLPDNRSVVHFDPPLPIEQSGVDEAAVRDVTQKIAYSMQAYIQRDPAQWMVAEAAWPNKGR